MSGPIKLLWDGIHAGIGTHPQQYQLVANNLIMILGLATAGRIVASAQKTEQNVFLMQIAGGGTLLSAVLTGRIPSNVIELLRDATFAAGVIAALGTLSSQIGGHDPYASGLGSKRRGTIVR